MVASTREEEEEETKIFLGLIHDKDIDASSCVLPWQLLVLCPVLLLFLRRTMTVLSGLYRHLLTKPM